MDGLLSISMVFPTQQPFLNLTGSFYSNQCLTDFCIHFDPLAL